MASKRGASTAAGQGKIRVRMYRVGFGDCFLLSLPDGGAQKHILVDCGVHARGDIDKMSDVIDDIAKLTAGKLAVVIATHAHQDHISGFAAFPEKFEQFDIGEVWMPWLENPRDAGAKKLQTKRVALATSLRLHLSASPAAEVDQAIEDIVVNATGIDRLGDAPKGSNKAALDLLGSGFHGKATVRYLEAADEDIKDAGGIHGLFARVLAPSRDESFLSKMDPPLSQRYKIMLDGKSVETGGILPFGDEWLAAAFPPGFAPLDAGDVALLEKAISSPMQHFALALDKVLNNTSLVVLFRIGGQNLLFPGDAQWGNWQSWLDTHGDVLPDVTFYKVAHHGSVNATPKKALEGMTKEHFAAMASTQSVPWPSIPAPKLVQALNAQTGNRFVRSDSITIQKAPQGPALSKPPRNFVRGPFWFDYVV